MTNVHARFFFCVLISAELEHVSYIWIEFEHISNS